MKPTKHRSGIAEIRRGIEPRRRKFIAALLAGRTPQEALGDAGYVLKSRKAISSTITSLRRHPDVRAALEREEHALTTIAANTPARLEAQISALGFSDINDMLNPDGSLKPIDSIPPQARAAIKQLTINTYTTPDGSSTTRTVKVTLEAKQPALQSLAEIHDMIRPEEAHGSVAQAFQVNIHLGPENVAAGQQRNKLAQPAKPERPAIETTTESPPPGEPRN